MLDPSTADVDSLVTAIDDRDKAIRDELNEFVKGTKARVDV
jgi:iron uptake system EfeUOB component EfeO/EfeM